MTSAGITHDEPALALLAKLNAASWTRSFTPEADVTWADATTTPEEWRALYDSWSLLLGSRHHDTATDDQRMDFARYQQMNLMMFTALFERTILVFVESLYRDDDDAAFQEYLTHFLKEETYHTLLFIRAIARIQSDAAAAGRPLRKLPERHMDLYLRVIMATLRWLPSKKLRHGMFFFLLRFVEEITLQANTVAARAVPRADSLVPRVWHLHALDEARHVAFDDLMMRRARLPGPLQAMSTAMTKGLGALASMLLNLNEIWAARTLGVRVGYLELPRLIKGTTAPFKRRVFQLLFKGKQAE